jgi:hypothetical protein
LKNKIEDLCEDSPRTITSEKKLKVVSLENPGFSASKDQNKVQNSQGVDTEDKIDFISGVDKNYDPKTKINYVSQSEYDKLSCVICFGNSGSIQAAKCGHLAC